MSARVAALSMISLTGDAERGDNAKFTGVSRWGKRNPKGQGAGAFSLSPWAARRDYALISRRVTEIMRSNNW